MAPRVLRIETLVEREGYLWVPLVRVFGNLIWSGEPRISYSKALRDARDFAIELREGVQ